MKSVPFPASEATLHHRIIPLSGLPLLFADESGIAARKGVARRFHLARTLGAPVVEADQFWEGNRVYVYGSVYHDPKAGEFRLWYMSLRQEDAGGILSVPGLRPNKGQLVLYAVSKDGLNWVKPALGLYPVEGCSANNIVFDLNSPNVLWDEAEPDPARRYKMIGLHKREYYAAFSPDGLNWRSSAVPLFQADGGDTITICRDPASGGYLAFHKRDAEVRGFKRRTVWLSRSDDFETWTESKLVFAADETDDAWATEPDQRSEIYTMSVFPHAAGFVGLPVLFRVTRIVSKEDLPRGQSGQDGPLDVQLATSLDGVLWSRPEPRVNMIPRGVHGGFDAGGILGVTNTAIHFGGETWIYYTALTTGHGAPIPPKRLTIGRAAWRRHGFASLDAGAETGRVETVPLRFAHPSLVINADARQGALRVALLEADGRAIPGYGIAESSVLQTDEVSWQVSWNGHAAISTDRPLRVMIEFTHGSLFSIESNPGLLNS